ncbi:phosphotransferase [Desulfosarcina sp.]|nr:phosphotransferase [Desulfosarcina sp.]
MIDATSKQKKFMEFIKSKSGFLEEVIKNNLNMNLRIKNIEEIEKLHGRVKILELEDNSKLFLKLEMNHGIMEEVMGMKYAEENKIPGAKLLYHNFEDNPLNTYFFISEHLDIIKNQNLYKGRELIEFKGEEYQINKIVFNEYIKDIIGLMDMIHQKVNKSLGTWVYDKALEKTKDCMKEIKVNKELKNKEEVGKWITKTETYLKKHENLFKEIPIYHLHGDLVDENLPSTNEGLKVIDWQHYGYGDYAYDVSYFCLRTIPQLPGHEKETQNVIDHYSKNDADFFTRFKFYMSLFVMEHMAWSNLEKDTVKDIKYLVFND